MDLPCPQELKDGWVDQEIASWESPLSTQRLASFLIQLAYGAWARQRQTLWGEWGAPPPHKSAHVQSQLQIEAFIHLKCVNLHIIRDIVKSWL